jgi:hypothetical protein
MVSTACAVACLKGSRLAFCSGSTILPLHHGLPFIGGGWQHFIQPIGLSEVCKVWKEFEKNPNPRLSLSFSLLAKPLFLFHPVQASQPAQLLSPAARPKLPQAHLSSSLLSFLFPPTTLSCAA